MELIIFLIILLLIFIIVKEDFCNITEYFEEPGVMNEKYKVALELGKNYLLNMGTNSFGGVSKPTVMFDIDDTLLDASGPRLKKIKQIIELLNLAKRHNLLILIITARDSKFLKETKDDLRRHKIYYDMLFLRNKEDDFYEFKAKLKEELANKHGVHTILSVGDNFWDISGSYSGYGIKLPNQTDPNLYHINAYGNIERVV